MDGWHEFAWDGVSFDVPADWNLSAHDSQRGVTSVTMEDDVAVRLQAEWFVPGRKLPAEKLKSRYDRQVSEIAKKGAKTSAMAGLPDGWMGNLCEMPDSRGFAIVFYSHPAGKMAFLATLHFAERDTNRLQPAKRLVASFKINDGPLVPWKVYDVACEIPREFKLASTSFVAGRKHMVFEWQLRKLSLWFFSLADRFLKDRKPEDWVVEFLNKHSGLKGPFFGVDQKKGIVTAKRSKLYPLGHFEEIGRGCMRYHVSFRHDAAANTLMVRVLNYRNDSDVAVLPKTP